ncbi:hypothetical protein ABT336_14855 [Micromonospora sp. NPDC000207]|uniref:hypothetical protein n=1 Tax=Micromonospora sp. NPDC000207 TaxID=3154246 RepID=UPI00332AAF32
MAGFDDYVALARQLSDRRRDSAREAAVDSGRRRDLHAAVDHLDQRLAAQARHLDHLGRTLGVPPPPMPDVPPGAPGSPTPGQPGLPAPSGPPAPPGPPPTSEVGRPGPVPHPASAGESSGRALSAVRGPQVPAQRSAAVDPAAELDLARRLADDADRHAHQAEQYAHRPALLPGWSPLARALAVYTGCAAVGVLAMLGLVLGNGIGLVDGFTLGAWMCAGLPALSFFAGYAILGRWGKPALVPATGPRYVHFGFLICFVLVPVAYCAYLVVIRTLR